MLTLQQIRDHSPRWQEGKMSDILRITLARLADGRKIADDDIVALCDRIAELEAALEGKKDE